MNGSWDGGTWHDGTWENGEWYNGTWKSGRWNRGYWGRGIWEGKEDRMLYMLFLLGIIFDSEGYAEMYRVTQHNGHGLWCSWFVQPEGEFYVDDAEPAGSGTCCKGIHASSIEHAWSYFGIDLTHQLWKVKVKREDILDCDGRKIRIRGGIFSKVPLQFLGE